MQVIEWAQFLENGLPLGQKYSSVTIGVFDGVHKGHQSLIKRIVSYNAAYAPVVITFRKADLFSNKSTDSLMSFQQKAAMLESLGVEILLVIDFTDSFRRMSGKAFLEILHKHGNIGFFAVGGNFRCGYGQDTDAQGAKEFFALRNIPAEVVPEVAEGPLPISSSRIRSAIANGDLPLAEAMLGHALPAGGLRGAILGGVIADVPLIFTIQE